MFYRIYPPEEQIFIEMTTIKVVGQMTQVYLSSCVKTVLILGFKKVIYITKNKRKCNDNNNRNKKREH